MPIIITADRMVDDIAGEIARLEALTADLEMLGNGILPSLACIAAAPLIDNYVLSTTQCPMLAGENHGHPILTRRFIQTSELCVVAPTLGWVRTMTRFYRLGKLMPREARGDR